jgi:hypothetical protein
VSLKDLDATTLNVIVPQRDDFERVYLAKPLQPFAGEVLELLANLASELLAEPETRGLPDVATFAFWCRSSSLNKMKSNLDSREVRIGRGLVFHVAPGNVPINFAYSLVAGLLSGNANIVRLPSNESIQISLVCAVLNRLLDRGLHATLRDHIRLVRYSKSETSYTDEFSEHCDVRIVWGGDRTISEIRKSALSPRAFDVTFADRYSICLIDSVEYLSHPEPEKVAKDFFNDTFLFDQNACTAPHLIIWVGEVEQVKKAKNKFWALAHAEARRSYELQAISSIDKLSVAYAYLASNKGTYVGTGGDNIVARVDIAVLAPDIDKWKSNCGLFYEYHANSIADIVPLVSRRFQTLSYLGFDPLALQLLIVENGLLGIDRIVKIGRTLDFELNWDGYDLIRTLSRVISA